MTKYKERFERALSEYSERYNVPKEELLSVLKTRSRLNEMENWPKELQAGFVHLAVAYGFYMKEKDGTLDKHFYEED